MPQSTHLNRLAQQKDQGLHHFHSPGTRAYHGADGTIMGPGYMH